MGLISDHGRPGLGWPAHCRPQIATILRHVQAVKTELQQMSADVGNNLDRMRWCFMVRRHSRAGMSSDRLRDCRT